MSKRRFCILAAVSCILGVLSLVVSFSINPGPPADATNEEMLAFGRTNSHSILWGAWLQAVGPVFIVLFAFALVHLAGAMHRLAGWMTLFGATTLMTVSLIEITFYMGALWADPPLMPSISMRLISVSQHFYFMVAAPALFFPLGIVLIGSPILPRIFGYLAIALALAFAAVGMLFLYTPRLSDTITQLGAVQPLWWLAAAIALIYDSRAEPLR